jgi:hypothetical protein
MSVFVRRASKKRRRTKEYPVSVHESGGRVFRTSVKETAPMPHNTSRGMSLRYLQVRAKATKAAGPRSIWVKRPQIIFRISSLQNM